MFFIKKFGEMRLLWFATLCALVNVSYEFSFVVRIESDQKWSESEQKWTRTDGLTTFTVLQTNQPSSGPGQILLGTVPRLD